MTRRRYSETFPCPACGGHARMRRGEGRRCSGYALVYSKHGAARTVYYCSRVESERPAPSGDLWAHWLHEIPATQAKGAHVQLLANPKHVSHSRKPWTEHHERHAITFHAYGGEHSFEVVRFDAEWRRNGFPKSMPRHRDRAGNWWVGKPPGLRAMTDAPLYRQPQAVRAIQRDEPLYIVEGEADADAIAKAGAAATCNPCGAGKWKPHHSRAFAGLPSKSRIIIVRDRDEAGTKHAALVYHDLWREGVDPSRITVVEAADGKDARDHLGSVFTLADFIPVPVRVREYPSSGKWGTA